MLRPVPKPQGRKRDRSRLAYVALLPCYARRYGGCRGRIQVAHVGRVFDPSQRVRDRKCDDDQVLPMCERHHDAIDGDVGGKGEPFKTWTRERLAAWCEHAVVAVRLAFTEGREPEAVRW